MKAHQTSHSVFFYFLGSEKHDYKHLFFPNLNMHFKPLQQEALVAQRTPLKEHPVGCATGADGIGAEATGADGIGAEATGAGVAKQCAGG